MAAGCRRCGVFDHGDNGRYAGFTRVAARLTEQVIKPCGFYLSATKKSSGKTILGAAIVAALTQQGKTVQTFKKGPDYIDAMWQGAASGRPCYNLDFHTQGEDEIAAFYASKKKGCDLVMVEGNKGLYDGVSTDGADSNAAMAALLGLPIVLVINCRGITRGIAPLVLGQLAFGPELQFAGVILNQVVSSRHESKLRAALDTYTDISVLGAVPSCEQLVLPERHLGLLPSNEHQNTETFISAASTVIKQSVDLEQILQCRGAAAKKNTSHTAVATASHRAKPNSGIKIGIARDAAFGFYYPDDLEALAQSGAECVFFDALNDAQLPNIDGLFIGGGFPETQLLKLANNKSMLESIRRYIDKDGVVYAECGGLMLLCRSISYQGQQLEMVGAIAADARMQAKPQGRGYVKLRPQPNHPWGLGVDQDIDAHEFHYCSLDNLDPDLQFAYSVKRGHGVDGLHDGFITKNVLANFAHQRAVDKHSWVNAFIDKVARHKDRL